jgi:hypothetical protein
VMACIQNGAGHDRCAERDTSRHDAVGLQGARRSMASPAPGAISTGAGLPGCEGRHRRKSSRLTIPVSKTRPSGMAVEVGIGDGWLTLVAPGLAGEPWRLDEAAVRQPRKN